MVSSSQQLYKEVFHLTEKQRLRVCLMYPKVRARKRGSWGVNPGSLSPLFSIVPGFLEWASSLYVYVVIWNVKKGIHGMHFLPLIAGLLKECSSSACTFGTKHWAKKTISPVLWPASFSATSCELGPCVHANLNHGTEPVLKWLMDWHSESDTYRSQKAIEAKRKVGARKYYRTLGEKYRHICKYAEKDWKLLGGGIVYVLILGGFALFTLASFLIQCTFFQNQTKIYFF